MGVILVEDSSSAAEVGTLLHENRVEEKSLKDLHLTTR